MQAGGFDNGHGNAITPDAHPQSVKVASSSTTGELLPVPVLQSHPAQRKKTRFKKSTVDWLRAGWQQLTGKFGAGQVASSSEVDVDTEDITEGDYGAWWGSSKRGIALAEAEEIDEVVVEREWGDELKSCNTSEQGGEKTCNNTAAGGTTTLSTVAERDDESIHSGSTTSACKIYACLRWSIWPAVYGFFDTRFSNQQSEEQYRRENWYIRKPIAIFCATFYIMNWVVSIAFVPHPVLLADKIFIWGIAPTFTFPILPMIVFDLPRNHRIIFQVFLSISTWMWAIYLVAIMYTCGFYTQHRDCGTKDFLSLLYFAIAPPVVALFGMYLDRLPYLIGTTIFMSLAWGMIVPQKHTWTRNVINFVIFHLFLLYLHYQRENGERRLYTLREQLKVQFRATQKAQVNERKAADSKRRLTSYVFHEVRVPLNTALLAVQNMAASRGVDGSQDIEFTALEGSLSMMSKVLNDVLDFNRMDSGRFESVAKPYAFHQVMKSLFVPLRLATDARGLEFMTELDESIDEVAKRALYQARGYSDDEIVDAMAKNREEEAIVVGDETRLRQIVTNLASNACKFTPAGGKLSITTKLVLPTRQASQHMDSETLTNSHTDYPNDTRDELTNESNTKIHTPAFSHVQLSLNHLARHNSIHTKLCPLSWIVVRIEVSDTGTGIRPKDMVDSNLFSAFTQTELGRQQGGKGTGLGLALVRQIVKLSGGRLGVQSKLGSGSTFWVELPLGVGAKAAASMNTPQFTPQTTTPRQEVDLFSPGANIDTSPGKELSSSLALRRHLSRTKAMHSIMEQHGMVEISTKHEDQGKILTRTIGDSSTGTDPTPSLPLTTPESSPIVSPAPPPTSSRLSSDATIRPNFVQLPSRRSFGFGFDETLTESSPGHTPSDSQSSVQGWDTGLRVLVVDDDPLTRKLMARMLTRLGCRVSTAENGSIALDLILNGQSSARPTPSSEINGSAGLSFDMVTPGSAYGDEQKYAVVFLDNQMPVVSGIETVSKLRELGRKDFVVGVTGNALLDDQQEFYGAGVDHVLTKPVQEKALKSMLSLADERRKQRESMLETQETPAPP
ncbi:hypothetical protein BDY19DRAFT_629129 [Irpex rosettiformis]|uniref:Uncharacterized protein n=1 Tax=Irpex rosettiformis TaxID=378272 RepID=A0ACB8UAS1_9APHY|nr:hypothetical protein BDY19DRAFT_629129 [Irpex rosettiformis]